MLGCAVLLRSLWGIHSQEIRRGETSQPFRNQHLLGLCAEQLSNTSSVWEPDPPQDELYNQPSKWGRCGTKLCNDLSSGTVPFVLIEKTFLFGLNPTRVTSLSQYETWTWILPDTFFSHICSWSFQGTWHKPGTSPQKRASSCYCFCHTCPRQSRFWTRWVMFHSHTTISHGGYTTSDTLARYSWELSVRTANSNL